MHITRRKRREQNRGPGFNILSFTAYSEKASAETLACVASFDPKRQVPHAISVVDVGTELIADSILDTKQTRTSRVRAEQTPRRKCPGTDCGADVAPRLSGQPFQEIIRLIVKPLMRPAATLWVA